MIGRTVIIVHPSELVCRGLASVLDGLKAVRILCFSSFSEIRISEHAAAHKLLLFVPASCRYADDLLELRSRIGEHRLIGLFNDEQEIIRNEVFDELLSINTSGNDFLKLAEDFFEEGYTDQNDELTNREREVLRLVALGHSNKSIAENLFISTHTVISHRKNITEKLGIKSVPGLTVYAIIQKLVDTSDISGDQLL
ncbi:MAG TPA: LuxR C-terminal-related transcriptional regulator [Draconibacterium sp.]|nr:LuxR C-terminal-related transcriptional regulator [Draconibacterium sp.]